MTIDCNLLFSPVRLDNGEVVLVPVLVSDDGDIKLQSKKVVTSIENALSMYSGFTLATSVEVFGGIKNLTEATNEAYDEEDKSKGGGSDL